jgi:hypothetical protein
LSNKLTQTATVEFAWPKLPLDSGTEPPKLPDTKTTSTAEYVAVAMKTLSRLTPVDRLSPEAKRTMNAMVMPSRVFVDETKFRASIGPMTRAAAMKILIAETSWERRSSSK